MKWLKRKLRNWLNNEIEDCYPVEVGRMSIKRVASSELESPTLNFKVMKAQGGTIVETSRYDHKADRHYTSLHIIQDSEDMGEQLGKIVTYENLKV